MLKKGKNRKEGKVRKEKGMKKEKTKKKDGGRIERRKQQTPECQR